MLFKYDSLFCVPCGQTGGFLTAASFLPSVSNMNFVNTLWREGACHMPSIAHQFVIFGSRSCSMYGRTVDLDYGWPNFVADVSVSGNRYCDRPQPATICRISLYLR